MGNVISVSQENTANVSAKSAILRAGGGTLALAMAMLEDKHLNAVPHSDYPFGDQYPNGQLKIEDAANFGVFKMNWHMIKQCPSMNMIAGNSAGSCSWRVVGARINGDPKLATQLLMEAMKIWTSAAPNSAAPLGNFWAGHRWGESGLKGIPPTDWNDVSCYYRSVQAIKQKCDSDPTVWNTTVRYGAWVKPV